MRLWYKARVIPRKRPVSGARRARRWRLVFFSAALALVLASCRDDLPQSSLNPAGPIAERQAELFGLVFWIAVGVFVLVEGALVYSIIRYRRRPDRDGPVQTHGNTRLEVLWTVIPAVILAGIAVPTVASIFDLARVDPGAMQIRVTGHQWWWEVEYPEQQVVTANEIHIPTDTPVEITLESKDVIHSFWVPRLAGKQDLVPGRTEFLRIQASEPGIFPGTCAEYCGLSHANMRFRVVAQEPGEFDRWAQGQAAEVAGSPPEEIEQIVTGTCMSCHQLRGLEGLGAPGQPAPDLTHLGSRDTIAAGILRNDPEDMARWLRNPPAAKPGSLMPDYNLTEDQIEALVEYLESLE